MTVRTKFPDVSAFGFFILSEFFDNIKKIYLPYRSYAVWQIFVVMFIILSVLYQELQADIF